MITDKSIDKKYRGSGWNKEKEIKYRKNEDFEKDLESEIELSKKIDKTINKNNILMCDWKVTYFFEKSQYKIESNIIDYKYIIFQASNKKDVKKLFDKWNKDRLTILREKWYKEHPKQYNEKGWCISLSCLQDPEYFVKIYNIEKEK